VSAFQVKLFANDLNCVDVPLNPTHSLTHYINLSILFIILFVGNCLAHIYIYIYIFLFFFVSCLNVSF